MQDRLDEQPKRSRFAGIPPGKLTAAEQVARNHELVVLKLRRPDLTLDAVGAYFGISGRSVAKIWIEWRDSDREALKDEDPVDVIHEHIAGFRDLRSQAAELGATTKQDTVMLGCLKLVADLRQRDIALRQETGLLPHDLGRIAIDLDLRFVVDKVTALLRKYEVPREDIAELVAVLDGEVTPQTILAAAKAEE